MKTKQIHNPFISDLFRRICAPMSFSDTDWDIIMLIQDKAEGYIYMMINSIDDEVKSD